MRKKSIQIAITKPPITKQLKHGGNVERKGR